MPMTATMAPYTLFILDDDTPLNPREDHDCLGKMVCWHSRYSLGEKHDYDEPSDFLRSLLFSEYSSGHNRNNPVFAFLKSGKAKDARLEYNRSTREWELRENQHWSYEIPVFHKALSECGSLEVRPVAICVPQEIQEYCMELFGENVQIAAASHDLFAKRVNGQIYRPLVEKYIAGEKRL